MKVSQFANFSCFFYIEVRLKEIVDELDEESNSVDYADKV
jgi:hypothetical protein